MSAARLFRRLARRRGVVAAGLLLLCAALFVWVLFRPTAADPPQGLSAARPIFLLVHARHSTLVIPVEGNRLIRYSYGDWQYYAEGRKGALSAARAVLFR